MVFELEISKLLRFVIIQNMQVIKRVIDGSLVVLFVFGAQLEVSWQALILCHVGAVSDARQHYFFHHTFRVHNRHNALVVVIARG